MLKTKISDLNPIANADLSSQLFEMAGLAGAIEYPYFSIAKTVLKPGAFVEKHYHKESDEFYLFTAGKGQMQVNQDTFTVGSDDLILLQSSDWHQLIAEGDVDLEFYAITRPAYTPEDFLTE